MKIPPWFLGALALTPLAGALVGQQISAEPIGQRSDVIDSIPASAAMTPTNTAVQTPERLPDHYAMKTPEGTVEVHELALRGRNAYRYDYPSTYRPDYETDLQDLDSEWSGGNDLDRRADRTVEADYGATDTAHEDYPYTANAIAHHDAMEQARTGEAVQPVIARTADIDVPAPQIAHARVVDVQAELEAQRR